MMSPWSVLQLLSLEAWGRIPQLLMLVLRPARGTTRRKTTPEEVYSGEMDTDSAYILFYEQQGVDYSQFLPRIDGKKMADTSSMDEDFESDYKKYCVLQ